MDNREDLTSATAPAKVVLTPEDFCSLTPEEQIKLMESNKLLEELMEREERQADLDATLEEAIAQFNDCIDAVSKKTNITISQVDDHVDCLKIFLRERPNWSGTLAIDAAAEHRDRIEQQVRVIVAGLPEGQIQIQFV